MYSCMYTLVLSPEGLRSSDIPGTVRSWFLTICQTVIPNMLPTVVWHPESENEHYENADEI